MAVSAHVRELVTKHSNLEEKIKTELQNPLPDAIRLIDLKKRKLYLKEKINRYSSS